MEPGTAAGVGRHGGDPDVGDAALQAARGAGADRAGAPHGHAARRDFRADVARRCRHLPGVHPVSL